MQEGAFNGNVCFLFLEAVNNVCGGGGGGEANWKGFETYKLSGVIIYLWRLTSCDLLIKLF